MTQSPKMPLCACLALVGLICLPAIGADKRPMSIVDLLNVPAVASPRLSPDNESVVYQLAETDWQENKTVPHVWMQVLQEDSEPVQLTRGKTGEEEPRWSPAGDAIVFIAKRGDDEHKQIYRLPTTGGEAERITNHDTAVSSVEWHPDGNLLYFLAADPKSKEEKQRDKLKDDVIAFDEDYKHRHLWQIDLESREEHRVTEGDYSVREYRLSRDGEFVAFHRAPSPLFDDSLLGEVWLMSADGEDARQLTDNPVAERGAELSPDGQHVLFTSRTNQAYESYYNSNLFVVGAEGGEATLHLEAFEPEVVSAHWGNDSRTIYLLCNTGVSSQLFRYDLRRGEVEAITQPGRSILSWHRHPRTGAHLMSISTATNPGDLWLALRDRRPRQVTRIFDHLDEEFTLPRLESLEWAGADGVEVEGLLYYPIGHEAGKRYPLVVQTHGGPAASDKFSFGWPWGSYPQVLTGMGYLVFKPNYRGSTGYGDAFLRDMVNHYFQNAHLDVMTGVDHLIEAGIADGDKMAKMGWSGGGHMTNKIITHTDRFKAASSGAGAVNWISMYAQSDVRTYRTPWFGGTPWQENAPIERYWDHSPIKDISKVRTPTLVLVGKNDARVPAPQSVELYRANGVPTHLYMAPRSGHGWQELRHQLFKINVELEWFERYVHGREYEFEPAPANDESTEEEEEE